MEDLFNQAVFLVDNIVAFYMDQFGHRDWWQWVIFFMPFYVFGEFPRYILPGICLFFGWLMGRPADDKPQKQRFLATQPKISILIVGWNEEDSIAKCIESLLQLDYPQLELIVVDDNSTDRMYEIAKPYADRGEIRLFKNTAATGRSGRPTASNLALHYATGDYVVSVDADTSFDRDILLHMVGPFYDPAVGAVAGNLKVRNIGASIWTDLQAVEYMISIGLWKRWLNLLGMNMQASGAFGAFRREALEECGAWDPELAEDADLSLKVKKAGWKIVFAPAAIAMTNAPETRKVLTGQRIRWDKGAMRTYFHKHRDLFLFWRFDWRNSLELCLEYLFTVFFTYMYIGYLIWMLWFHPAILIFVWLVSYLVYLITFAIVLAVAILYSERKRSEWHLLATVVIFPFYKSYFRLIRCYALTLETFRINYEETYLPQSAWRNVPKW